MKAVRWTGLIALLGLAALAATVEEPTADAAPGPKMGTKNLVPNGDFEQGKDNPTGWQTVDGLSTFWVKDSDPKHGKVIKFDTDVYQTQAYKWWVEIAKGAKAKDAPKKIPTVGDKYDTLAGLDGVWFWSDYIPVQQGKAYWLTLDAKGAGMMVWLVGYTKKGSTAFGSENGAFQEVLKEGLTGKPKVMKRGHVSFIHSYSWKGQLAVGASKEWKTFSRRKMPFRPTKRRPGFPPVHYVRVMIYPFWPPGEYYVDNVKLVEIEDKEEDR